MKKWICCLLAFALLFSCALADVTNYVSIPSGQPIQFRASPGGQSLGEVHCEVLVWLGETRHDGTLWYRVETKRYGIGYVEAKYALPYYFPLDGPAREDERLLGFSNGLEVFCREVYRIELTDGLTEAVRVDIARLLYECALIALDERYAVLTDERVPAAQKDAVAAEILRMHYDEEDPSVIFSEEAVLLPGIRPEDWHGDLAPNQADEKLVESLRARVRRMQDAP